MTAVKYQYSAVDAQGKSIEGTVQAEHPRAALRELQRQGLTVIDLRQAQALVRVGAGRLPGSQELLMVLHQLTTLLESGVTLNEAVTSLAETQPQPFVAQAFTEMAAQLQRGTGFAVALRQSGLPLPSYFQHLAEAGELTGRLAEALRGGLTQYQYELAITAEFRNALIYPIILIVSGIAAVMLIFVLVVPKFAAMLTKTKAAVPLLSQWVLGLGMFVNQHLEVFMLGGVTLAIVAATLAVRPATRQRALDAAGRAPLLGSWLRQAEIGRWAALLGTLLSNRVELMQALELSSRGVRLSRFRDGLNQVRVAVRRGVSLSQALAEHVAFDATSCNLIRVGERSGELPRMLQSLATLYTENGRQRMKRFLLLLEPVAILLIGGVIGLIMTGIILAIVTVNDIKV